MSNLEMKNESQREPQLPSADKIHQHAHKKQATHLSDVASVSAGGLDPRRSDDVGSVQLAAHVAVDQRALGVQRRVQADHVRAAEAVAPVPDQAEVTRR